MRTYNVGFQTEDRVTKILDSRPERQGIMGKKSSPLRMPMSHIVCVQVDGTLEIKRRLSRQLKRGRACFHGNFLTSSMTLTMAADCTEVSSAQTIPR